MGELRHAEQVGQARGHRYAYGVVDEREEQVLSDPLHDRAAYLESGRYGADVVVHEYYVGRAHGDVGAAGDRYPYVGLRERGRIVDAVPHHRDVPLEHLHLLDRFQFVPGTRVRTDLLDPEASCHIGRHVRIVARDHHGTDPHGAQRCDRLRGFGTHGVGDRQDPHGPAAVLYEHAGLGLLCKGLVGVAEGLRIGTDRIHQFAVADGGLDTVYAADNTLSRNGCEVRAGQDIRGPRTAHDGGRDGVLGLRLGRCRESNDAIFGEPFGGHHVGHFRSSGREGTGLVEDHRVHGPLPLQHRCGLVQYAVPGGGTGPDDYGERGGEAECARAGDYEHGDHHG